MKIAIDARMISFPMHGISRYAVNLVKGLLKIDKTNSYLLISNNRYIEQFVSKEENVSFITTHVKLYGVLEQVVIPKLLKENKVDIFHSPTYSAPIFQPCKVIMTIHDMIHMIFPDQYPRIHQYYYRYIVKPAAQKSIRIITVSECSKKDISQLLGIHKEKIIVTYNSAEEGCREVTDKGTVAKVLSKFNLHKRFILYIGNHKFHKNLERLIDAYARLKKDGLEHIMIISGHRSQRLAKRLDDHDLQDHVLFAGDIDDNDLPSLYSAADVCVMPSLYEGFGLPALEAMACNTPVITSNTSSLPEIVGDAGIMVDPYSTQELADAMQKVLKDGDIREDLRKKGCAKAKEFTWGHVARRTLDLYDEVYSEARIGFNAQKYLSMNTGVGVYTHNISKAFLKVDTKNMYYIYSPKDIKGEEFLMRNAVVSRSNFTNHNFLRILWEQMVLPINQFKDKVDIFHYPDHTLSLIAKVSPAIITVHDLAFLRFPELFNKSRLIYKRFAIERSFKMADFIIAVSHSTKNDVISTFPFVKGKIEVVHLGVDKCYRPIEDLDDFKKRFNITSKIILFLGTLEPRKNIVRLIQAYKILLEREKIQHKLIIAGTKGWLYDQIFREVVRLRIEDSVIFTGFIGPEYLPCLYNCADVFVYPSLYEGFGLPPLEAMACGVPVVTSNTSSLPEVVGDAGRMIDPYDTDELAREIYAIISDKDLRLELKQKGMNRAKQFTWEKTAEQTVNIYKKVLGA